MNFTFKLKVDLPWHGKSERVLTHCTLGVPLKCQASVERLVATRSPDRITPTWVRPTNTTPLIVW